MASPGVVDTLWPDKLVPSTDSVPERFELGTPPFADLAGVVAAVDHLAGLDDAAVGSRRQRVLAAMAAAEAHEQQLFGALLGRSEEHTSELQSPDHLVCRLLLEKKKKKHVDTARHLRQIKGPEAPQSQRS